MNLADKIGERWVPILGQEFEKEYLQKLGAWITYTRQSKTIYPESQDIFKALKLCPYGQVKVVIIGQDPYYDGTADGLAFSYKDGLKFPKGKKSLDIILEEIERDCYDGFNLNKDYQLDYLAKQGVLLLNSILTVFKGKPASHKDLGWENFTDAVIISQIMEPSRKVFMLWGNEAKAAFNRVKSKIDYFFYDVHLVLEAKRPASDLYNSDSFGNITPNYPNTFSGCKHFSQANQFLLDTHTTCIDWLPVTEPHFNLKLSDTAPF